MIKIGITGGIASGKSTATEYIRQKGYTVIDADEAARAVVEPGAKGWLMICGRFGYDFLNEDKTLNRKKLGDYIFEHPEKRKKLEEILHPLIFKWIDDQIASCGKSVVFIDMPLLYEIGYQKNVDEVWVIYTPEEIQKERLMERNQLTAEEAQQRIDSQWSIEEKRQLATAVIDNRGSIESLHQQLDRLLLLM